MPGPVSIVEGPIEDNIEGWLKDVMVWDWAVGLLRR